MADSYIQIPADSTGKKVRTSEITVGANTVHQHFYTIVGEDGTILSWGGASPSNALGVNIAGATSGGSFTYARCELSPQSGEYGINVNVMPYGESSADMDTGAGTDYRLVTGIMGAKSGGGALIPGDATAGLKVDLGADNDVTVTGTVTATMANGKTLLSTGGSAASSGNNTLISAGTNKLKVYAFSLSTTSTTAVTCIFQSGSGGTELWRVILQAPTGANSGANLAVSPPAWLFATASATLLNLNLSGAITVHYSVSYFDES